MTDNEGQNFITISLQRISNEERMQILKRELVKMKKNGNRAKTSIVHSEKCRVGRLRKKQNVSFWVNKRLKCNLKNRRISKLVPTTSMPTNFHNSENL
jgi:hypothetical protein